MKRAEVAKLPFFERCPGEVWYFDGFNQPINPKDAARPLSGPRGEAGLCGGGRYPTHAEALHAALEAVGLTPANPEKEQS